jgi:hypothetical protein
MSGWPVLDVAIGLIFVYLLLAVICTTLNEGIMTQMRSRAKFLDKGIQALLGDARIKEAFLNQPLIRSYTNQKGDSVVRRIGRTVRIKSANSDQCPSYLSGFVFTRALHNLLTGPDAGSLVDKIRQERHEADRQIEATKNTEDKGGSKVAEQSAPDPYAQLHQTLSAVLANAKSPDDEMALLNQWYQDGMERVSGWYKRHAQAWVRFLALVVTIALNADTIQITKKLWTDPTLRAQIVEAAKTRSQKGKAANYRFDDEGTTTQTEGEVGTNRTQTIGSYGGEITDREQQLLGNLMGWDREWQRRNDLKDENGQVPFSAELAFWRGVLLEHWLGWLFTMIAVSLGAPFWFDLLKRFMNIRNAGRITSEQPAKDTKSAEVSNVA